MSSSLVGEHCDLIAKSLKKTTDGAIRRPRKRAHSDVASTDVRSKAHVDAISDALPLTDGCDASPLEVQPAKPATHRRRLTPERNPQADLYSCDAVDAPLKAVMGEMEHPMYGLQKKRDTAIRRYEHNGVQVVVTPSVRGIATVFDKEILIYAVSQLVAKMNAGIAPQRSIKMKAYDLLVRTNRGVGGHDYDLLEEAFERLAGTRITTNIPTADERTREGFGLIEQWKIVERTSSNRKSSKRKSNKCMDWVQITLSEWMFRAVKKPKPEVLTLHCDYFLIKSTIDRRLYEIARKHCGAQPRFPVGLALLQKKTGSRSSLREFREAVRKCCASDLLPEYHVRMDGMHQVIFTRRKMREDVPQGT